ncbi:hypothetical protein P3T25_009253 [Paraburkholderia sp. GAS32]
MSETQNILTATRAKSNDVSEPAQALATWALAPAQLVSRGSVYYSFSLLVVLLCHLHQWLLNVGR